MNTLGNGWRHGVAWLAITGFVTRVTTPGSREFVEPELRVAAFDSDGTLWCEKPLPVQLDFLTRRFVERAKQDPSVRGRQPWRAAAENDLTWFGEAVARHYRGDDTDLSTVAEAVGTAFDGVDVGAFADEVALFLSSAAHPVLQRPYLHCGYPPMRELLRYLDSNAFTCYIAAGGDRDFARPLAARLHGVPPERVVGGTSGVRYRDDGRRLCKEGMEFLDEGAKKPGRFWSRVGRRPILTVGNSNGDIPLLRFTGGEGLPALRLLVDHDDAAREFSYTVGAEDALAHANTEGWTLISVRDDWDTVF
ncbi:haloacid dehalogenase-like hydrolase [Phytomonospora endophytica]|uniref:Phosphoglycolate phosphatase-like HAD superfamily hydrolase n=1 Tax=Phytomonospora endophytica TaxID=714109 RepID=A0A841FMV5_9ACTN|nr:HAD family hydrolase [Phytomonospora endophytica]MBB6034547.1 phosphoglycolate phosphatase-like HAD superfamily hydrolase [Phytomonospora endophytica]GIG70456.1 haloacid dehalogenase [Phytomonospora endophytica]